MNTRFLPILPVALAAAALAGCASVVAQNQQPEPPVPVSQALPPPAPAIAPGNQQLYVPAASLVSPETAQAVVARFKAAYEKLGSPRIVIYVNRQLVDTASGFKLVGRTEHTRQTSTETKSTGASAASTESTGQQVSAHNTYEQKDAAAPALADRQTVRDIERLFGRPLRAAGAKLVDQQVAAELIGDQAPGFLATTGDQAQKDRAALAKDADVAIEILVSSRNLTVPGFDGPEVLTVPDIQATAIRLSDAQILGQASASDVLGRGGQTAMIARNYSVQDITEATALALMEDMSAGAQ